MPLTNAGRDLIATAVVGGAFTPFDNANAYIGVGDGSGAFAKTQTDLQGTNKFRQSQDAGFPTQATNTLSYRATYSTAEANFTWNEWGVFNASTAGTMFQRKVESLGTKPNTQTWQFSVDLTITNP